MFLLEMALKTAFIPALVCGSLFWITPRAARNRIEKLSFAAALSLAAGYLAGHMLSIGLPPFPPVETTQWLFVLVGLSVFSGLRRFQRGWGRLVTTAVLIAALLTASSRPMLRYHWGTGEALLWCGSLFAGLLLLWHTIDRLAKKDTGRVLLPLAFLIVCLASAAVFALSATALLAQLAAAAAASLAVLFLLSLPSSSSPRSWLPVGLMILTGLGLNGYFYAQVTGWNALLLAGALPAAFVSRLGWTQRRAPWLRVSIGLAAVILVAALAVTGAAIDFLETPAYDDY